MNKYFAILLSLVFTSLTAFAADAQLTGKEILGEWWTSKKDARIQITEADGQFSGKISYLVPEKADKLDVKNPDPEKQKLKVLGLTNMWGFKFKDGQWLDGKIYDPKNGKTYSCKMSMDGENLLVRGYIGFSLLGRTETFSRYTPGT